MIWFGSKEHLFKCMNEVNVSHGYSTAVRDCKNFRFLGRTVYLEEAGRLNGQSIQERTM